MYANIQIYNVEQSRINIVYFNVDINSFKQLRNKVAIFNVELSEYEFCYEYNQIQKVEK